MSDSFLSVTSTEQGLHLKGDLVYASVSDVVKAGGTLLQQHPSDNISVNCADINRLDSAGISLLLEWKRRCKQLNKTYQLVNLPEQAISLMKTYKLSALFEEA